jgi:LCP family protein required for cell wall assembly
MRKENWIHPEFPEHKHMNFDHFDKRRKKSKSKWKTWALRSFLVILAIILGYAGYVVYQVVGAVSKGYDGNLKLSQYRQKAVNMKKDPFTILFIGVDQLTSEDEKKDFYRTDVLILAAINPKTKTVKLLSIPRDTYAEIANTGGHKDKINAAATYGRLHGIDPIENTRQTVENFLYGVPVDYYVKINFKGFIQLVDAVGGVDVYVKKGFKIESFDASKGLNSGEYHGKTFVFKEGPMHLTGEMALPYVRMRKQDPMGDFGRQERQREVIKQILDKIISFDSITKVEEITSAVGDNLTYNIPPSDFIGLLALYQEIPKQNIETIKLHTTTQPGTWYELVTKKERRRVSNILKQQLEIPIENDLQQKGNG